MREQQARAELREREAAAARETHPRERVADARRLRDARRAQVQKLQKQLKALSAERQASSKALAKEGEARKKNDDPALSHRLLVGPAPAGDAELADIIAELKRLKVENEKLEAEGREEESVRRQLDALGNERKYGNKQLSERRRRRPVQGATRREGEGASRAAGAESCPSLFPSGADPVPSRAAPQELLRPSPVVSQYHAQIQAKSAVSEKRSALPLNGRRALAALLRVRSVLGASSRSKQARVGGPVVRPRRRSPPRVEGEATRGGAATSSGRTRRRDD